MSMSFYISRKVSGSFETVTEKLKNQLSEKDYLIAADINVQGALKQKMNADLPKISIIGTNTPEVGLKIFSTDPRLGTLLPFSFVLHDLEDGSIEVSVIEPTFLFQSVEHAGITKLGIEVRDVFLEVLNSL